jgi:hypothetical protein
MFPSLCHPEQSPAYADPRSDGGAHREVDLAKLVVAVATAGAVDRPVSGGR